MLVLPPSPLAPRPSPLGAQSAAPGKANYDKWCAGCHGDTGAGDGSAASYMLPRPRDFTKGVYQIRTTASGELPTDDDLRRVIDEGMPGTAMPGWKSRLNERERDAVIAYIKSFSAFFAGAAPTVVDLGDAKGGGGDAIAQGRETYRKLECWKCHGDEGRGDGTSAPTLKDDWDHPIRAADLSASWRFNGGDGIEQIYARLRTGLDGTPMPSFSDAMDAGLVTDEQLWNLARYVRGLSPDEPPRVREVIRAGIVEGALPAGPADSAWRQADSYWVPLVGQIIAKPRWFAPMVDGVWVQALHDGRRLALRLRWSDPSRSPDPPWDEWLGRVASAMTTADAPNVTVQGPDRLLVQWPVRVTDDVVRPYFLGGSARSPVHLWRWASTPDAVEAGTGRGLGTFTASPSHGVTHAARWEHGQWQLQLTRDFTPADTAGAPRFQEGHAVPIAFLAADGSNGEDERRGAVSAWYAVHLDTPTPPRVYVAPALTMLLTAGVGSLLVRQAQRRERGTAHEDSEER
jgi:mono/diheme cytochrome c family protein